MVQTVSRPIKHEPYVNIWFLVDSEKSVWVKNYVIQMHESWYGFEAMPETLVDGRMLLLNFVKKQEQESHAPKWILQLYDATLRRWRRGSHSLDGDAQIVLG
ncbi:hypothetical protein BAE44_0017321 [Dichanthelium oligosanthes]|uniref:F-box associated domain-containing protein n=1 Tax=Dichanthelium oligosanthes TaxID=888268 RepID=A0A1E5V920_9POAL|nr:hypothetical protein BAE44_0017321 [Dichanthelium oligosanthes]